MDHMLDAFKAQGWSVLPAAERPAVNGNGHAKPAAGVKSTGQTFRKKARTTRQFDAYLEAIRAWGAPGISARELAGLLGRDTSTVHTVLASMFSAGLVTRSREAADGFQGKPYLYRIPPQAE